MTYNVPGIYIEEKSGSRPIAGVGTAMPAFIGLTEHCPLDKVGKPVFVASWTQYQRDFTKPKGEGQQGEPVIYLPLAVYGYFQNGGTACYILSLAELKPESFVGDVSQRTGLGALTEIDEITMLVCPDLMSLHGQEPLNDDAIIAVQQAMLNHCFNMKDRFAILDAPPKKSVEEIATYRKNLVTKIGQESGKYGALYYPWIKVANPAAKNGSDQSILIPPSGHIAGIYARVDQERGVHKAPANHVVHGAVGLERQVIDSEQGTLNPQGINCIRTFSGRGILVWGARTLAEESSEWRYINVRRLFNYVEESIVEGTQWVVFEPNDMDLWERVKRAITAFLTRVWRSGALVGVTPEEAFYVKCDADLNPESVRDAGQLFVEVGLAPVKPAEFIIFSFSQMSAGGSITE